MTFRSALIAALLTGTSAAGAEVTALNNLVYQLLDVQPKTGEVHTVDAPREGWLFIRLTAGQDPTPTVRLDNKDVTLRRVDDRYEAMRYLPAGPHTIAADADHLEVRAIGELY